MPERVRAVWPLVERALRGPLWRAWEHFSWRAPSCGADAADATAPVAQHQQAFLPPPSRFLEINGAEALVHSCRLRARPRSAWLRLRALTNPPSGVGAHHGLLDYALEGMFHVLMGEPWVRPEIAANLQRLNFQVCKPSANATLARTVSVHNRVYTRLAADSMRCEHGIEPIEGERSRGWSTWRRRWRERTELALRSRATLGGHQGAWEPAL